MDSVQEILAIALVDGISAYRPPITGISSVVQEKLFNNAVTTVLYEEIEKELANG